MISFVIEILSFVGFIFLFILIICIDAKVKGIEEDMEITASKCIDFQMQLHKLNEQIELTNMYLKKIANQQQIVENEEK